jgi:Flp pilus assembly protein TadG
MKITNRSRRQGTAIVEFALVAPFLVLAFLGTVGVGIALGRSIHAVQFCRDMAHMYVDGVDFTLAGNKAIAVQLAQGSGMTANGGDGVVIFSRISTVYQADCDAALVACNNLGVAVITQRVVVGNAALRASDFGTPTAALLDSLGNISSNVYLTNSDSTVRATGFTPLLTTAGMTQQRGDATWVAESYFAYPGLNLFFSSSPGVYSRFLF